MASRKGLGVFYPWGSRTGWTLMANTGSLAVPVPPRVSPGQLAEVPGPLGGHWVLVASGVEASALGPAAAATD